MADLDTTQRAHLLLDDDSFCIWPNYTGTSSDPSVAITGDGGDYRLAVLGIGPGTCTITVTRASDGETADLLVTVEEAPAPEPPGTFTIHLGTPFPK